MHIYSINVYRICKDEKWNKKAAVGRVIVCMFSAEDTGGVEAEIAVWRTNASGLIIIEPPTGQTADVDILPTVYIDIVQGTKLLQYLAQSFRFIYLF